MPPHSVPSQPGLSRRRRWTAIAFVGCLLVTRGLSGEVPSTTTPNLATIDPGRLRARDDSSTGGGPIHQRAKGESTRGMGAKRSIELVARQAVTTTTASSATAAPTATQSTISPSDGNSLAPTETTNLSNLTSAASSPAPTSTAVPDGYTLPQPFDSTLGTNFSSTACPSFFATFLADPEFIACAPFSLLLGTSSGFFQAQRSPYALLPHVLDASCAASSDSCAALMDKYARDMKLQNTCGQDLARGNALAQEALEGFRNYRLYREVGCQRDNTTQASYCFADASANAEPDALYFYYLAEGTSLPSGTVATCDYCLQTLMGTYSRYAVNATLPIAKTYLAGRSVAALTCGPNFAPLIAKTTTGAASAVSFSTWPNLVAFVLFTSSLLLLY
ncbi:hypothetical protein JCM3766R1_001450 [Sporobolomyces carnicolor]